MSFFSWLGFDSGLDAMSNPENQTSTSSSFQPSTLPASPSLLARATKRQNQTSTSTSTSTSLQHQQGHPKKQFPGSVKVKSKKPTSSSRTSTAHPSSQSYLSSSSSSSLPPSSSSSKPHPKQPPTPTQTKIPTPTRIPTPTSTPTNPPMSPTTANTTRILSKFNSCLYNSPSGNKYNDDNPPTGVIDLALLRTLSWNGIPPSCRSHVWQVLIGYLPSNRSRQEQALARKRKEYVKERDSLADSNNHRESPEELASR